MRVALSFASVLLFIAGSSLIAGPVSVDCSGSSVTTIYSSDGLSGNCRGTSSLSSSSLIDIAVSLTHDATTGWYTLKESSNTYIREGLSNNPNITFGPGASVRSSINYSETLRVVGDVRPGYLEVEVQGGGLFSYNGYEFLSLGILNGSVADGEIITAVSCPHHVGCSPGYGYYNMVLMQPFPVLLGVDVPLFVVSSLSDGASMGDGTSGGSGSVSYRFRFTEINGEAATLTTATPEPATLALCGFSLIGIYLLRWKHRLKRLQALEALSTTSTTKTT